MVVPDLVWVGFLRIVTHPRILPTPRSFEDAWSFVDAVVTNRRFRDVAGGAHVVPEVSRLAAATSLRGTLVTDAYIAAVAVGLGASVVTFDRDFRRFDDVRVVEPA